MTPIASASELEQAKTWLSGQLNDSRYNHSMGARQKALELAEQFAFSEAEWHQTELAALLHDNAKLMSPVELLAYCQRHDLQLDPNDRENPQTLHPIVGAHRVEMELGIGDAQILNAIAYHTTGRPGMSRVEKVVYIADKIEENTRNPLFVKKVQERLRGRSDEALNEGLLYLLDETIRFVMDKGQLIHPRTLEARNDVIRQLRRLRQAQ